MKMNTFNNNEYKIPGPILLWLKKYKIHNTTPGLAFNSFIILLFYFST